jgi:hypothetical protein
MPLPTCPNPGTGVPLRRDTRSPAAPDGVHEMGGAGEAPATMRQPPGVSSHRAVFAAAHAHLLVVPAASTKLS